MMEEPIQFNESRPFVLLKKYYRMCMDSDSIERDGLNNIKKMLKELGGWPVVEGPNWAESQFDWKELVYKFATLGLDYTGFIRMWIGLSNTVVFDEGVPIIKKEFLAGGFNSSLVQAYYNFSVDYAIAYGANPDFAQKDMRDFINFHIEFSKILLNSEDRRNITDLNHKMKVRNLRRLFPYFPWISFINNVIQHPNITITDSELITVGVPTFIPKMEGLIKRTSKRVQANYLFFRFVLSLSSVQPQTIKHVSHQLTKVVNGLQELTPNWKECVATVRNAMEVATSALYVQKYFNEKLKNSVSEMIAGIKHAFVSNLNNLDWMGTSTRNAAVKKVRAMIDHTAYPLELLNNTATELYYAKLEPADDYLSFHFNHLKFAKKNSNREFKKVAERTEWQHHSRSYMVNAFYSFRENSIEVPAGILQDVFFVEDRPQYLNYGGIGFIIGHEITHGFDDQGGQIDGNGYLKNWWTNSTKETFLNKTKCIIDQYSNISLSNINKTINGHRTQGENIADNGGLKISYMGYESWVKRNGEEASLPGLKYTPNQLFWISFANVWCSKERLETLEKMVLTAYHSPAKIRVNQPIRNSKQFSIDYNCPIGSKMNPLKKMQCMVTSVTDPPCARARFIK